MQQKFFFIFFFFYFDLVENWVDHKTALFGGWKLGRSCVCVAD